MRSYEPEDCIEKKRQNTVADLRYDRVSIEIFQCSNK